MNVANAEFGLPPKSESLEEQVARLTAENAALRAPADHKADDLGTLDNQGFPKEYVKVEIFQGREKHDLGYVPIGIKGYVFKVTRGKPVILPKVFVTVLEQAVEEITVQSEGGLVTRPALRFPFHVSGPATEAEWLEFSARMRAANQPASAAVTV
jgi:hypothetical protein